MKLYDILAITAGNTNVRLIEVHTCAGIHYERVIQGECSDLIRVHNDFIKKHEVVMIRYSVEVIDGASVLAIRYSM